MYPVPISKLLHKSASIGCNQRVSGARGTGGLVILVLFITNLTLLPQHVEAQMPGMQQMIEVRETFNQIEALQAEIDTIREWQRDGLNRRIDGLGLDALARLHGGAPDLLANAPSADRLVLSALLDDAANFALQRDEVLEQRAADERALVPKFERSAQADIARAFMEDLFSLREQYLLALADQIEIRRAVNLESDTLFEQVRQRVGLLQQILTGQIRLDAMSLEDLASRLADKPVDENLQGAQTLLQAKQSRNLVDLERVLDVSERLGIPVAEQRSLLLRERRQVGVELLQSDVFAYLWREQLQTIREDIARDGPNILFRTLLFIVLLLLVWLAARLIRLPIRVMLNREGIGVSTLLREILISASSVVVFAAGAVFAIGAIGISLGPVLAGIGVLGIIVGLAVQDSLSNLAAGVMILIYRPYDVEDLIRVNGSEEGLVKRMNLLATTIATFDNQSVVIPNGRIWGDTIINYTAHPVRRVDIKISATYLEDPDRVIAVLEDMANGLDYVLDKPQPIAHVADMEDSSMAFMIKPWVRTADYWTARWDLPRQIKKRFDAEGIEIPFPQRVVTLKQSSPSSS